MDALAAATKSVPQVGMREAAGGEIHTHTYTRRAAEELKQLLHHREHTVAGLYAW